MAARPPPARPHIGLNPSSRFTSYSTSDWVDDDAWDSGSDSESPSKSSWKPPSSKPAPSSSPKPVPKSGQNNSSTSTLASSYTHLHAPSPSSYPPRTEQAAGKNGWTIVRKSTDRPGGGEHDDSTHAGEGVVGVELDGSDLIVGDMDPEVAEQPAAPPSKPRQDQGSIRDDVDEIVNGRHRTI